MMSQVEILTWSFGFGVLGGAVMVGMIYYWLWDQMRPNRYDFEWVKSEVKDLRTDVNDGRRRLELVDGRVHALEHPKFRPSFGDWVLAEKPDKSGKMSVVYLGTHKGGVHRVIAQTGSGTTEYDVDEVEPLDD